MILERRKAFWATFLALPPCIAAEAQQGGWPVDSNASPYPIANTLGELVMNQNGLLYQHPGLDILVKPFPEEGAPFAVVTTSGYVTWVNMSNEDSSDDDNFVRIQETDGMTTHDYEHLEYNSILAQIKIYANNTRADRGNAGSRAQMMPAGEPLAQIHDSFVCDLDHLHYEIRRQDADGSEVLVNPLKRISPVSDSDVPAIPKIFVARHNRPRWQPFETVLEPQSCVAVSGEVDIIVEAHDRDDSGSGIAGPNDVGLYRYEWRACPEGEPECEWVQSYGFETMNGAWGDPGASDISDRFSFEEPWKSEPEAWLRSNAGCPAGDAGQDATAPSVFAIVTGKGGSRSWKTSSDRYGPGTYDLSVKVTDIGGNTAIGKLKVCVQE